VMVTALAKVKRFFPSIRLLVAGKVWRDDFSRYEELIRSHGLSESVIAKIRYIPDDEAPLYYRAADLAVLPYRKIYQSGVLLMAMSLSTPVLVSDLDGMLEIVEDGKTGWVFHAGSADSLADRIVEILSNPDKLARVGAAGFEKVRREHDWNKIGRMTLAAYTSSRNES
jgi:D-inositol-3-phosphate glycosyltransferase